MRERLQEIRIRADRPILLYMEGKEYFLTFGGEVTELEGQAVRAERGSWRSFCPMYAAAPCTPMRRRSAGDI